MQITTESKIADIATEHPATIRVFQRHHIDFCCGGKIPLAEACDRHGVDAEALLAELRATQPAVEDVQDWQHATLATLVAHIQERYHMPLRGELPRLGAMMAKVLDRHGERLPEIVRPLHATFDRLQRELLDHMLKEDAVLFPFVVELESGGAGAAAGGGHGMDASWVRHVIDVMEADHDAAGAALASMREVTRDYTPPEDACPTFRGLYHGLAELERDMHVHVHLENNVLFPRALRMAVEREA